MQAGLASIGCGVPRCTNGVGLGGTGNLGVVKWEWRPNVWVRLCGCVGHRCAAARVSGRGTAGEGDVCARVCVCVCV
jgi:hypothetical protein